MTAAEWRAIALLSAKKAELCAALANALDSGDRAAFEAAAKGLIMIERGQLDIVRKDDPDFERRMAEAWREIAAAGGGG